MGRRNLTKKLADMKANLRAAYENGYTLRQLAALYKVSPGTVRARLFEEGATLRSRGKRKGKN